MTTCFIKKQPNNPNNLYCGFQKSFNDIRFCQNEHLIQINVQPHLSNKQFCQLLFWKMLGHQFKRVIISWFALFQLIWQLIYCLWLKLIIQIHVHCWIYLDTFTASYIGTDPFRGPTLGVLWAGPTFGAAGSVLLTIP